MLEYGGRVEMGDNAFEPILLDNYRIRRNGVQRENVKPCKEVFNHNIVLLALELH
jgi:hypothetical protein